MLGRLTDQTNVPSLAIFHVVLETEMGVIDGTNS